MTLVQLRHLIALAECASFSKAAEAMFVTQPALSRSIRALEAELRMPLVDRIGRRIEFTPFGQETLARARQLVFDAEELRVRGERMAEAGAGTLRLGMGSGPGAMLAVPLMQTVAKQHAKLRVEISRGGTAQLVQALRARTLDALVIDARSIRPAPDLNAEFMHEMRGAFMVRRGHPLAKRRGAVSFESLLRYPIASTPLSDEVARMLVEHYGPAAHPEQCVTLRSDELASLAEVALQTDAVLLAIRGAAAGLVELTLRPAFKGTARFGLVTLARRAEAPALHVLRRLMEQRLRD